MRSSAPRYAPNDGVIDAATAAIGAALVEAQDKVGEVTLTVTRDGLIDAMIALRDTPGLEYQQLMEIAGVDYPEREERFDVCYHLLSVTRNHRLRVRVTAAEDTPVPSVTGLWPVANWLEREVYDMYGVLFDGHPDLRRILTDYGFRGHPFRKDFPLTGFVELRYSEEAKRVVYEPVKLAQDFRNFEFMSPWEGAQYVLPGDEKAAAATPPAAPPPAVPEAKGAPSPVTADQVVRADASTAPAKPDAHPGTGYGRSTDSRAETGAGEASPGNQKGEKPAESDVIPTKGAGQNQ
ncbi:NADH-quinone oxidoreductase subunit C [Sphingomonas spermidinifaciens]|uniref:NADH-quinone oxidoreductase subunit C n=1 Tax=Sphingomonas spermidinifaciens TaxID=1141889 RepID=A0A2A4B882_9SPHN|nr:NADH-quinone oxidoreductase subunit C [Sphingomonas spermidinifaciens]PCD03999.1 NADH-quinone oxidoreductase subunit C [Sphingomonas spermidinifaciens]